MGARSSIQKRIDKLQIELGSLHGEASDIWTDIEKHEFAIGELQALLKTLPDDDESESATEIALRKGSDAAQARDALREVRQPLHVNDLLTAMGKPVEKKARVSLAGQISFYVRKNQIFTRPQPNTFGLKEWEASGHKETRIGPSVTRDDSTISEDRIEAPGLSLDEVEATADEHAH